MPQLSVVMPAHDEAQTVAQAVCEWTSELDRLGIDYVLTVYDDGSRDGTGDAVRAVATGHGRVRLACHANVGHGPTIMRGYRDADGEWVLQVDSDREMRPDGFEQLWRRRDGYDLLIGRRVNRSAPPGRLFVTWMARLVVRVLFGGRIRDVNAPYRLVRRTALSRLLPRMPGTAFAPNAIISGLAVRDGLRIGEWPVEYHARRGGVSFLTSAGALRVSWRCVREAASVRLRDR